MSTLTIGKKYNWVGQPERLVYLGYNWSGNGYWHQFAKVDSPGFVWCEVLDADLDMIEPTLGATLDQPQPEVVECDNCGLTTGCMCLAVGIGSGPHRCPACSQPTRNAIAPIPRQPDPAGYTSANGLFFAAEPADAITGTNEPCKTMADAVRLADQCRWPDDEGIWWVPEAAYIAAINEIAHLEGLLYPNLGVPADAVSVNIFGLIAAIRQIPVRREPMSGQTLTYVQLDEVLGTIEDFAARHARGVHAVACIDSRHLPLLRKGWDTKNCLKHKDDAGPGDVLLYAAQPTKDVQS